MYEVSDYGRREQRTVSAAEDAEDRLLELLARYEHSLYGFLVTLLGDRQSALDCAQETFLRAYRHLSAGKSLTGPWLYKVARNLALKELKHRQRVQPEADGLEDVPDRDCEQPERIRAVRRALAQLSSEERELLYLSQVDGFKSAEIAQMLGIRAGAVRMRLSRAHARFRDLYGDR